MRKQKFDFAAAIVTFAAAALSLFLMLKLYVAVCPDVWYIRAIFAGLIMSVGAAASIGALYVFARLRRSVKVKLPKLFTVFNAVLFVLIILTAFIGQIAYSVSVVSTPSTADAQNEVVLLVDSSNSLAEQKKKMAQTAQRVIENTSEETALALGFYTTDVDPSWPLTMMDEKGKKEMLSHLSEAPDIGGTGLTKAVNWAQGILEPDSGAGKKQTIIILTDGSSPLYPQTAQEIIDAGIIVNSLRTGDVQNNFTNDFVAFVTKTGGQDIDISNAEADAQIDSLMREYGALSESEKTNRLGKIEFLNRFVLLDDSSNANTEPTVSGILIRFIMFIIIELLFQLICFKNVRLLSVAIALGGAVIATIAVTLCSAAYLILPAAIVIAMAVFTVFSVIMSEGEHYV